MNILSFCQNTPLILALYGNEYGIVRFYALYLDFRFDKMAGNKVNQLTSGGKDRHGSHVFNSSVFQIVKIQAD